MCVSAQVESYVEHIRGLLEEREMLTTEYERDNEQLRLELKQSRLLHGTTLPRHCSPLLSTTAVHHSCHHCYCYRCSLQLDAGGVFHAKEFRLENLLCSVYNAMFIYTFQTHLSSFPPVVT